MAEKGILVADAVSGESIACRDAVELDDDSNARIIQRVDVSKGKLGDMPGTVNYAGTAYRWVTAVDTKDLANLPVAADGNLITVGDKSTLVVFVEFDSDLTQTVGITPMIFAVEGTNYPVSILETKEFSMTAGSAFRKGTTPVGSTYGSEIDWPDYGFTGNYVVPVQSWDVLGAYKIGLHITAYDQVGSGYVSAWGHVI